MRKLFSKRLRDSSYIMSLLLENLRWLQNGLWEGNCRDGGIRLPNLMMKVYSLFWRTIYSTTFWSLLTVWTLSSLRNGCLSSAKAFTEKLSEWHTSLSSSTGISRSLLNWWVSSSRSSLRLHLPSLNFRAISHQQASQVLAKPLLKVTLKPFLWTWCAAWVTKSLSPHPKSPFSLRRRFSLPSKKTHWWSSSLWTQMLAASTLGLSPKHPQARSKTWLSTTKSSKTGPFPPASLKTPQTNQETTTASQMRRKGVLNSTKTIVSTFSIHSSMAMEPKAMHRIVLIWI